MIWPVLRALCQGELTPEQVDDVLTALELAPVPRAEGPATAISIAHRSFQHTAQTRLIVDFSRLDQAGWVLALFCDGEPPSDDDPIEADYRARFRQIITRFGLTLIEIDPPLAADEVHVPARSAADGYESGIGYAWDLPFDDLDHVWPHLGLNPNAPREVKKIKLDELMHTPVWTVAPALLRQQAEAFMAED